MTKTVEGAMLRGLKKSYTTRTILTAIVALITGVGLMMGISFNGIKSLFEATDKEMFTGINRINLENLKTRIGQSTEIIDLKMRQYSQEQAIQASVLQNMLDHKKELRGVIAAMDRSPYFRDKLEYNGNWYQNKADEPATVLVQAYNLKPNKKIRRDVQDNLKDSLIMDLLYPAFYRAGPPVQGYFFTGGENKSYMRATPWVDLGRGMDKIYPGHSIHENWEAFSPGLINQWKLELKLHPEYKQELSKLAIIKPPSIDGGSGDIIMTMNQPVFDVTRTQVMGSVSVDIKLDEVIRFVEGINLGKTGFAYISSSNGNILAVHDNGAQALGLPKPSDVMDHTAKVGYKKILRYLSDSRFSSVRAMNMPLSKETKVSQIVINGVSYLHIQKRLDTFNSWNMSRGIFKDNWTLGYLIPENEIMMTYSKSRDIIDHSRTVIIYQQSIVGLLMTLFIVAAVIMFGRRNSLKLRRLEAVTEEIMAQNYDVKVDVYADDEIGHLAEAVRKMSQVIKENITELRDKNQALSEEIRARESKERQIRYLENYDQLTNLPKTNLMLERIDEMVASKTFGGRYGRLVLIGLDDFRKVNESYSHEIGNEVIKQVSNMLASMNHSYELLAKLGGDEFALLYATSSKLDDLLVRLRDIQNAFSEPIVIRGHEIYLTASMGIASEAMDSVVAMDLLKNASTALNHAKEAKGSYRFYDCDMDANARRTMYLLSQLRKALAKQELYLMYQPIVELKNERTVGFEALIRWRMEDGENISPEIFIPLAEESGLITEIGEWVMLEALNRLKTWHDKGYGHLSMSVNISSAQFNESYFLERTQSCIESCEVPFDKVRLEITEGMLLNNIERVSDMLVQLRQLGVGISIDDFGTGYSSLNYLKNLQASTLKIDRSFIKEYPNEENVSIARVIVELGRNLNMKVVAEGVENEAQKAFLKGIQCDEAQGYLFGKPLLPEEAECYLRNEANQLS